MKTIFSTGFFIIFLVPFLVNGQNITVTGYISNQVNGKHLENVNIYESGSIIGTITDKDGFYKLMLPVGEIKLSAKLQGYKDFTNQMIIKNDTVFSIQLKPIIDKKDSIKIEENLQALKNADDDSKKKSPKH